MNSVSDNANLREGAAGKGQQSDQPIRFAGSVLGASIVVDIMRTHPMIIIGGIVQENRFFVPPDEFLQELSQRGAAQGA